MRRGLLARTEQQDQQVPEAIQDQQEQLEIPVYRELPELRERMEQRGLQGQVVNLVYQERADLQVQPETQDRLEVMERQVQPGKPGQQAAQARQAQRARMALAGPQGQPAIQVLLGPLVLQDRLEQPDKTEKQDRQVLLAIPELRVQPGIQVLREIPEQLAMVEILEQPERLVIQELMAYRELQVPSGPQVQPEQLE